MKKIIQTLPGFIICIIIALCSKFIGRYITTIGATSISILLGIFVGNTIGTNKIFAKGTQFAERDLLSYSVVLLGATISVQTLLTLGFSGVAYIGLQMIATINVAIFLGKKLGLSENFTLLMASGNAVCGSSAIAATAPVIGADDQDKGIAITIVNVTGTILMFLLPILSRILYASETLKTSAFIGGILQSVGQVVASGSLVSEEVKNLSTIFKIVRILFLIFVLFSLATLKGKSNENKGNHRKAKIKVKVPWYVIGFFVMCALFSINIISPQTSEICEFVSNYFEIIALAGIGMRVNLKELIKLGPKISAYAFGIAMIQIISAVLFIWVCLD